MAVDVSWLRSHAAIDGDVTDEQLGLYLQAAVGYLANAGVAAPDPGDASEALYDLAVYQLACYYYDHRSLGTPEQLNATPAVFGLQGIIHQLN